VQLDDVAIVPVELILAREGEECVAAAGRGIERAGVVAELLEQRATRGDVGGTLRDEERKTLRAR